MFNKIKAWFKHRQRMKLAKKIGASRYLEYKSKGASHYGLDLSMNDFIYAETDSVLVAEAIERRLENEKIL